MELPILQILTTNGFLLTRNKQAELIEKCSVTSFQITVDGDQEGHDSNVF